MDKEHGLSTSLRVTSDEMVNLEERRAYTMRKGLCLLVLGLFVGIVSACEQSQKTQEPWIPVLEDTGFSYLRDSVSQALTAVDKASHEVHASPEARSGEDLQKAMDSLMKLHFYYLPITEVRQLIYDADQLFYLKEVDKTQQKLRAANRLLVDVAKSGGQNLETSVNEAVLMIDDLLLNIRESSDKVPEKFKEVGHHVNLMATKGELILSSTEFHYE